MMRIDYRNYFDESCFTTTLPVVIPFQTDWYQKVFVKHFSNSSNILSLKIYDDDRYIGYGIFEVIENSVLFLSMKTVFGGEEVTDYGDIVVDVAYKEKNNEIWQAILDHLRKMNINQVKLDYIREDSLTFEIFKNQATEKTVAPYIALPVTWDEYLESLDRVDRKELKRKMRRLDTVSHSYVCLDKIAGADFEEFVRLHRLSSSIKKQFMSQDMKDFFWDLIAVPKQGWKINVCFLRINEANTAALLTFENESTVFGYNSGYDPTHNYYSVGLLLHAFKIKQAIESKKKIYDFMRGNERYKFDLGAKPLRLYQCTVSLQK